MEPEVQNDFAYWKELAGLVGFALLWWKNGRSVGNVEEKVIHAIEDVKILKDAEYCTKEDCRNCQTACQERTWDRLMLALEKRDREFDRKFAHICQGIGEIKAELKK